VGWSDVAWAVIVTYKDSVVGGALTTGVQGGGRVVVGVVVVVRGSRTTSARARCWLGRVGTSRTARRLLEFEAPLVQLGGG
jgi:hypothetical protein